MFHIHIPFAPLFPVVFIQEQPLGSGLESALTSLNFFFCWTHGKTRPVALQVVAPFGFVRCFVIRFGFCVWWVLISNLMLERPQLCWHWLMLWLSSCPSGFCTMNPLSLYPETKTPFVVGHFETVSRWGPFGQPGTPVASARALCLCEKCRNIICLRGTQLET